MPETRLHVELLAHTPESERLVAAAAKLCYSEAGARALEEGLTPARSARFVEMLGELGHESPIEHASFTFAVEGVSRSLLAQLTRHRMASFSVQSQRYVRRSEFSFITPPEIACDPGARARYEQAMEDCQRNYLALAQKLEERHFAALTAEGVPEKEARSRAEKRANEDARYVLPNAAETKLVMTMNARSLHNFFRLRCCNRAQWEIRELAWQMRALCRETAPALFAHAGPPCLSGPCTEGKMSCGQAEAVRRRGAQNG